MTLGAVIVGLVAGGLTSRWMIRRDKAREGRRMLGWASGLPLTKSSDATEQLGISAVRRLRDGRGGPRE